MIMGLLYGPSIQFPHARYLWLEVFCYLLFCNATDGSIFWLETDIGKIIQDREQGYLSEFGNTCNEDKLLILIVGLQNGKYFPINGGTSLMLHRLPGML